MKRYTPDELAEVLRLHKAWLNDEEDGKRAYLRGADLQDADLRGADLQRAYLRGADLQDADLRGADLQGAYLRGADLQDAYLQDADLRGADLRGADLRGADLRGADLQDGIKVRTFAAFWDLYTYIAMPIIAEDGTEWIRLGCFTRKVSEWENDFWNNPSEFPNDNSHKSRDRWNAYQVCLRWLEIRREVTP